MSDHPRLRKELQRLVEFSELGAWELKKFELKDPTELDAFVRRAEWTRAQLQQAIDCARKVVR